MNINPGKTAFTAAEHAALRDQLKQMLAGGMTQAAISTASEVPNSTLSQYLSDTYPNEKGKAETAVKLTRWLDMHEAAKALRGQMAISPSFIPMKAATRVGALLNFAHASGDMVLIGGVPGTCKTASCKQFQATTPRTWFASMDPTTRGVPTMLLELLAAMGVKDMKGTPKSLKDAICERAAVGRGLFIVDEAQHLSDQALEALRAINDRILAVNGVGVGIALLGNDLAQSRVATTGNRAEFAQVASRIAKRLWLRAPYAEDAAALAQAWAASNDEVITKVEVEFCQSIAARPGGLRNIEKTMKGAILTARALSEPLTIDHLKGAFSALSGV